MEDCFIYLQLKAGFISSGYFLHKIEYLCNLAEKSGKPIRRMLFDNISQIKHCFPLLNSDQMFLPALIDFFKSRNITALFTEIIDDPQSYILEFSSPAIDLVDNVIATQHLHLFGQDNIVLKILKTRSGSHSPEPMGLEKVIDFEDNVHLKVNKKAFLGFQGIFEKKPEPLPIFITVFNVSKSLIKINNEIQLKLTEKNYHHIHFFNIENNDFRIEQHKLKNSYLFQAPKGSIKVLTLDQHWAKWLMQTNILENNSNGFLARRNDFVSNLLLKNKNNSSFQAIPFLANYGIYCIRSEIRNNEGQRVGLRKFVESIPSMGNLYRFGFNTSSNESVLCTIFELVLNFYEVIELPDYNSKKNPKNYFYNTTFKSNLKLLLQDLHYLAKKGYLKFPLLNEDYSDCSFYRSWFGAILSDSNTDENDSKTIPYEVIKNSDDNLFMCTGSWYLGVAKGPSSELGFDIIEDIISIVETEHNSSEKLLCLPVLNDFYSTNSKKPIYCFKNNSLTFGDVYNILSGKNKSITLFDRDDLIGNDLDLYQKLIAPFSSIIRKLLGLVITPTEAYKEIASLIKQYCT